MLIKNICVYDSDNPIAPLKTIYIAEDGYWKTLDKAEFTQLIDSETRIIDAEGKYTLMPGMLDAHVHGQGGPDFAAIGELPHDEGLPVIMKALGKTGLSYAMATLVSLPIPELKKCLSVINAYVQQQAEDPTPGSAMIVGVHLEGPFISKQCRGAHAESALQKEISVALFRDIIECAPAIKEWKITIDPDLPGAQTFIREAKTLAEEGISVKVFVGHCNPIEVDERVLAGFTHLGNACQEGCTREVRILERKDAESHLVQWVLDNPDKCPPGVELIVDGVHTSRSFVRLIHSTLKDKILLVSDALGPSGLDDGLYKLGLLNIRKENQNFYLTDDESQFIMKPGIQSDGQKGPVKTLAGSAAPLAYCVQKYAEWIPESEIMQSIYTSVVRNPRISSLSLEARAKLPEDRNFTIFDHQGKLMMSLCNGLLSSHEVIEKKRAAEHPIIQCGFLSHQSRCTQIEDIPSYSPT